MKRLRLSQWSGQVLQARQRAQPVISPSYSCANAARCQSSTSSPAFLPAAPLSTLPSPPYTKAKDSAKLAALHARLSLSDKIPLETLARTLVTGSADPNNSFNNQNLAFLGSTILNYHVLEYLVCKWPRLPMAILYEAIRAYAGQDCLLHVAKRWGVESAAFPGGEVDPGLLQWSLEGEQPKHTRWGYTRPREEREGHWRRTMSSRVVMDDVFGDFIEPPEEGQTTTTAAPGTPEHRQALQARAHMSFVQAVIGAIYTHAGREASKAFVQSHILSRQFDPSKLFAFSMPTRELMMLCAREGFEAPIARMESETGRKSRTPVFVVGVYSGKDKLGEGAASSLDAARKKAAMNALKAWYLYSPGPKVRVPSDMMQADAKAWEPPHIDIGEII